MHNRALTPEFAAALRSLAEVQMQIQASRSATLDARAIGVVGVNDCGVLERSLLDSLAEDVRANHQALARKAPRLTAAFVMLALAITIAIIGGVH